MTMLCGCDLPQVVLKEYGWSWWLIAPKALVPELGYVKGILLPSYRVDYYKIFWGFCPGICGSREMECAGQVFPKFHKVNSSDSVKSGTNNHRPGAVGWCRIITQFS